MPLYGEEITFGMYKGKTVEQIHFINYTWLYWAIEKPNLKWIKNYMKSLPKIYPDKIKVHCGENHHAGCKKRIAVRVSLPINHWRRILAHPIAAYYWCSECDIYSAGANGGLFKLPLNFDGVIQLKNYTKNKGDIEDFHLILKQAYGIRKLTQKSAYKVFWE